MSQQYVEAGLRPAWSASRITWHMRHPESIVLTARYGGVTAGFAIMRYGDDVAHLNLLAVDPAHRRRGVARKIMMWLEETALTAGTLIIRVGLGAPKEKALVVFSALGYCELGGVTRYFPGVEKAIL